MIGKVVGNYRIVRELGSGAMGAVYEGVDVMVERSVAIKMLRAEIARQPDLIERFRVEAVTLAKLNHPSIATLYSFFREGENFYMVMEFVRGRTLEDIIKQSGRLGAGSAVDILCQTLDGLAHAHEMGILHRDIKPANIMITGDGRVKVTDFGIARVLGAARMTREGRIIGTLEYIAPERIRGEETDARSDLYSAGVVLFEALSGHLPFNSDTDYGLMQAHLGEQPPSLAVLGVGCPPLLEAVQCALAKAAKDRFQTAQEFRNTLMAAVPQARTATAAISAPPVLAPTRLARWPAPPAMPPPPSAAPPVKILPVKWIAAGAIPLLLLGAISTIVYLRNRPAPQKTASVAATTTTAAPAVQQQPVLQIYQQPLPEQPAFQIPQGESPVAPLEPARAQPEPVLTPQPAKTVRPPAGNAPVKRPAMSASGAGHANPAASVERPTESAPLPPAPVARVVTPEPSPAPIAAPAPVAEHRPAVRSIQDVHKLYLDRMPEDLKDSLSEEIARQMPGRLMVVHRKEDADAIMCGSEESSDGLGSRVTGGYLGMKDKAKATVSITDVSRSVLLWSSQAGDKTPIIGMVRHGGVKKAAERLVSGLKRAIAY